MTPRMRTLAFAGLLAASGCATTQTAGTVPAPSASASASAAQRQETPAQRCQRERRSRVQECIIESIATGCREGNAGNEDGFHSCVSQGLAQPNDIAAVRQISVTVSQGDDALSMRSGESTIMDIVRLEASKIDVSGVVFTFSIERLATAAPEQRAEVLSADVRMNYDGTTSGGWSRLRVLNLWNLRVQAADSGRAAVSFEPRKRSELPQLFFLRLAFRHVKSYRP